MEVTNRALIESQVALQNLATLKGLPTKTSYWIGRTLAKVTTQLKYYDTERQKLVDTYAKKDSKGNVKQVKDEEGKNTGRIDLENPKEFGEKHTELMDITVEFEAPSVKLSDLLGLESSLTPGDFIVLDWLIEDDTDE